MSRHHWLGWAVPRAFGLLSALALALLLCAAPFPAVPARATPVPAPAVPAGRVAPVAGASLPQPASPRRYGLPVALAVVALVGSGSLLVRTLLAEPPGPAVEDGRDQPRRW